jgi:bisphosphoglycerate-independent phosphoglycerate mutase (AlkP superfamily)
MHVDYRGLNKIIIKIRYSLPLISRLLDQLGLAKVYTKIDIHVLDMNSCRSVHSSSNHCLVLVKSCVRNIAYAVLEVHKSPSILYVVC